MNNQLHGGDQVSQSSGDDNAGGSQDHYGQYSANGGPGGLHYDKNNKRYRRTANEIERRFQCWCGKAYGSEGSLNQHKKLKNHTNPPAGMHGHHGRGDQGYSYT